MYLLSRLVLLADVPAEAPAPQGPEPGLWGSPMFLLLVLGLLFYFMILRPQRAKEQRFQQMLAGLKENDRVLTVGGIYGVVTNVQRDADRVTLRVDEATNTKIRVASSAIARVLSDESEQTDKTEDKSKK